jgi:hypothetical protein
MTPKGIPSGNPTECWVVGVSHHSITPSLHIKSTKTVAFVAALFPLFQSCYVHFVENQRKRLSINNLRLFASVSSQAWSNPVAPNRAIFSPASMRVADRINPNHY